AIRAQAGLTGGAPAIDLLEEDHEVGLD
ncbi:MAG: hypothetical protein K0S96_1619, partial [Geminicoccaceae bacterium]|nr:hypothetical protein [Geminicoccaceae bacterium]